MSWKVQIHQIDVGQGDSYLILFKKDSNIQKSILIDGGLACFGQKVKEYVRNKIGNNHLSAVIITHDDIDHKRGIEQIIQTNGINPILNISTRFIVGWHINNIGNLTNILDHNNLNNVQILTQNIDENDNNNGNDNDNQNLVGQNIWGLTGENNIPNGDNTPNLTIITANGRILGGQMANNNNNSNGKSIACIIQQGRFKTYLNGDLLNAQEQALNNDNQDNPLIQNISVYSAGHHGSSSEAQGSTNLQLLQTMRPQSAIISHGDHQGYKHPTINTLKKLSPLENNQDNYNISGFTYLSNPKTTEGFQSNLYPKVEQLGRGNKHTCADNIRRDPDGTLKISSGGELKAKFKIKYKKTRLKGERVRDTRDVYNDKADYNSIKNRIKNHPLLAKEIQISKKAMKSFLNNESKGIGNNSIVKNILNHAFYTTRHLDQNQTIYKAIVNIKRYDGDLTKEHIAVKIYKRDEDENYNKFAQQNFYPEIERNAENGDHRVLEGRVISRNKSNYKNQN